MLSKENSSLKYQCQLDKFDESWVKRFSLDFSDIFDKDESSYDRIVHIHIGVSMASGQNTA